MRTLPLKNVITVAMGLTLVYIEPEFIKDNKLRLSYSAHWAKMGGHIDIFNLGLKVIFIIKLATM